MMQFATQLLPTPVQAALTTPIQNALTTPIQNALTTPMQNALTTPMQNALTTPMQNALTAPQATPPSLLKPAENTSAKPEFISELAAQDKQAAVEPAAARTIGERPANEKTEPGRLREVFDQFVGQTFYSQMLKSMRDTVGKPAYFHGGRGEEVFQAQLDQVISEKLAEASSSQFTGPMFDLFTLQR